MGWRNSTVNMLRVTGILLLLSAVCLVSSAPAEEEKEKKYENIDFQSILNNRRVLVSYVKCLTDKGPCTSQGKELKRIVPEVINSSCNKCDANQKKVVREVINTMQTKYKDQWEIVLNKYDPKRTRQGELKTFLSGS